RPGEKRWVEAMPRKRADHLARCRAPDEDTGVVGRGGGEHAAVGRPGGRGIPVRGMIGRRGDTLSGGDVLEVEAKIGPETDERGVVRREHKSTPASAHQVAKESTLDFPGLHAVGGGWSGLLCPAEREGNSVDLVADGELPAVSIPDANAVISGAGRQPSAVR